MVSLKKEEKMAKKFLCIMIVFACLALTAKAHAADLKIGYVDMRKIFYEYEETKKFQKDLETKDQSAKEEFEKKTNEIRQMRDELELLSEKAKDKKNEELRRKTKELNDFRRDKGEELLAWRDAEVRRINKTIGDTTSEFAKKNGYNMVFNQMAFVYSSGNYDITDEILKELNK